MANGSQNPERRIEVDCVLRCPECAGIPYKVFRRQNMQADGTLLPSYQHVLWPAHPDVPPPLHPERIACPDCGEALRRVAP